MPTNPLQKVIVGLQEIIDLQAANPSDPQLPDLLINIQVELSQAVKTITGGGDDTNRGG